MISMEEIVQSGISNGKVFISGCVQMDKNSIVAIGRIDTQVVIFKLYLSSHNDDFMDYLYKHLHTFPFPEYIKFGDRYYTILSVGEKKYNMVVYPYIPSRHKICLNKNSIKNIVYSLWQIHKNTSRHVCSAVINQFVLRDGLACDNGFLNLFDDGLFYSHYEKKDFLTGDNLLHGDFRLSNILCEGTRIIDLEDAIWGPPEYDLGRLLQSIFMETDIDYRLMNYLLSEYEIISNRRINRIFVLCNAVLRFSHRIRSDKLPLSDKRIDSFVCNIKKMM